MQIINIEIATLICRCKTCYSIFNPNKRHIHEQKIDLWTKMKNKISYNSRFLSIDNLLLHIVIRPMTFSNTKNWLSYPLHHIRVQRILAIVHFK